MRVLWHSRFEEQVGGGLVGVASAEFPAQLAKTGLFCALILLNRKSGIVIGQLLHSLVSAKSTLVLGELVYEQTQFFRNTFHELDLPGVVVVAECDP